MTLRTAGKLAAIGVLLQALPYWVANVIPSWTASGLEYRLYLLDLAVIHPLVWAWYFLAPKNRAAALVACSLTAIELAYQLHLQYPTLAALSLDSITLVFGTVLPLLCWMLYLLGSRGALWPLLILSLLQAAYAVYQMVSIGSMIRAYGGEEPWKLIVVPLIWIVYWFTQAIFVNVARKDQPVKA